MSYRKYYKYKKIYNIDIDLYIKQKIIRVKLLKLNDRNITIKNT